MAQVDPSAWLHAMMFLSHHKMESDEEAAVGYIKRMVVLVIVGFSGCCKCTAAVQYGAISVSYDIALACRVILLSVNELPSSFKSWCELDLLCQMVQSELGSQCVIQCDVM